MGYKKSDEKIVFEKIGELICLNKSKPLKNAQISTRKAIQIAETIIHLPIYIATVTINLSNQSFIETVTNYHRISNEIRIYERKIKGRPIAQIIHSKVLSNCLFEVITLCLETSSKKNEFNVFIDNWSIPTKDISIYLKYRTKSLSRNIRRLFPNVDIKPIELLEHDTKRKRFIDSVTSVVSRNYHDVSSDRYSTEPFDLLFSSESINAINVDITEKEIDLMNKMLNEFFKKANKSINPTRRRRLVL
ncbi:MAG TPA: hypothetical protein ENH23_06695 [candidate division Zixibacteria bacterium]|nr:hypothetical protein [candidate division Zixibacteria bacterium]